ncbi:MAG TPA: HEAT repeat domain-containing protein [Tepidisphaeraceae bacterium]|nr:HEAT repeat domain-containing protein [Tepidisphaeraceae bacterium]
MKPSKYYLYFRPLYYLAAGLVFVRCGLLWGMAPAGESPPDALIDQLAADDSAVRQEAAQKLVSLGMAARPAVLAAMKDPDPQVRQEAEEIILKLPWAQPDDPPQVAQILNRYTDYLNQAGQVFSGSPEEQRIAAVQALGGLTDADDLPTGVGAIIRLLHEDPSAEVRWAMVQQIALHQGDGPLAPLRRENDPQDAALAAACGIAWLDVEPRRAIPLLQQAVSMAWRDGRVNQEQVSEIVNILEQADIQEGQLDEAADLLRQAMGENPEVDGHGVPLPLLNLFALQAEYGPLKGWGQDQARAGRVMDDAKILYCLAHLDQRLGKADLARQLRQQAIAASHARAERLDVAEFLAEQEWDGDAKGELKAFLATPAAFRGYDYDEVLAHYRLGLLASHGGDEATAASEIEMAMSGTPESIDPEAWIEVHWHAFNAAAKAGDEAAAENQLRQLEQLNGIDATTACDIIPALKAWHRTAEAERLFARPYRILRRQLDDDPENAMTENDLAWLEARCDENVSEALRLATAAVNAMPRNAAFIDTLADVNFQMGRFRQAAQLEQRALSLTPDDVFMAGQLKTFQAAAKAGKQP